MKRWMIKIPVALALIALLGLVVMLLWNAVIPYALNANDISYFQSLCLIALSSILLGRYRRFGAWGRGQNNIDSSLRDKVQGMSYKQKRELLQKYMQQQEGKDE